jgi:hypothetical protein
MSIRQNRHTRISAWLLLAAGCCAAASLPEVDLLDARGKQMGSARLRIKNRKCEVKVKARKLAAGTYHPVLAKARQCFTGTNRPGEAMHEMVAEGGSVVIERDGATSANFVFTGDYDIREFERIIAGHGLVFQMVRAEANAPDACGKLKRWFSPGREVRRGEDR